MPFLNPERLARIVAAVHRLDQYHQAVADTGSIEGAVSMLVNDDTGTLVKRELLDAITPETLYIVVADFEHAPQCWGADESDIREYLEHVNSPEPLRVFSLSGEGNDGTEITDDFANRWLDALADYSLDADDFADKLPEFIRLNCDTADAWRKAHRRQG